MKEYPPFSTLSSGIHAVRDAVKPYLTESHAFSVTAAFVGRSYLSFRLEKVDGGYMTEINGVEIKMADSLHFSEFLTEKPLQGYIRDRDIEEGDVVIDAGAFPGEFTIYAAKKGAKVIALEPDHENAEELRKNIELNGLDNVEIIEKGLWSGKGQKNVKRDDEFGLGSELSENGDIEAEVTSLDSICDSADFIKMDIEGAEIEALQGAEKLIENSRPYLAVATYHVRNGEKTCHRVEELLSDRGYEAETGYRKHLTTYGRP
jgi:FkbM family methyltransferase